MDDPVRFITHRGKEILLIDFSHATPQQLLKLVDEVKVTVAQRPPNSVLSLADFTGAEVDKAVATRMKQVLVLDRPYVKRSAWIGTKDLPKVFYENFKNFSRRDFPTFETREEAMDWLAGD